MPYLTNRETDGDINSQDIRQEIARFESVHPSIYALYELIDSIPDRRLADLQRRQVASIEDAFGLLGSVHSGKAALVHRYLTGTYLKDESPEGGRFKKEVIIDGQSYLLLIRDEGGPPDEQFGRWIDGLVLVFSIESEESFQIVCEYFERLDSFKDTSDLPIILVGTQDLTSEKNPRVIDDSQARHLAVDLHKCPYYETCATYGLNVERVFQDACVKIVHSRPDFKYIIPSNKDRKTLQTVNRPQNKVMSQSPAFFQQNACQDALRDVIPQTASQPQQQQQQPQQQHHSSINSSETNISGCSNTSTPCLYPGPNATRGGYPQHTSDNGCSLQSSTSAFTDSSNVAARRSDVHNNPGFEPDFSEESRGEGKEGASPSSTPTQSRKTRPKSNIFRKGDDPREKEKKVDGIGSGRSIPLKQGFLYKRTCKPLNKEWKTKKYVALTEDARLIYHPSIQDYVQNSHGKEIDLSRVTVKIPGLAFRQAGGQTTANGPNRSQTADAVNSDKFASSAEHTTANSEPSQASNENSVTSGNRVPQQSTKDSVKKRYRRVKSSQKSGATDGYESEGYEFQLISMDRQWHFEASNLEDRDEWVAHIDRAILTRLQLLESSKRGTARGALSGASGASPATSGDLAGLAGSGGGSGGHNWTTHSTSGSDPGGLKGSGEKMGESVRVDEVTVKALQSVAGNDCCADCGAADPDWASLNLGEMVCIGCSGVHRQLGTHISRVRSLHLDDWTNEAIAVMRAIGNTLANSVWEAAVPLNAGNRRKPDPHSSREEKETWIRAKYEHREFLPPLPYPEAPLQQQLIDAIARQDTRQVILCLARATPETVNAAYSRHDPRAAIHIAATLGHIVYLQLLLWYNGNPSVVDAEGRNAFYYAHCSLHFDCATFLYRNGCPRQAVPAPPPAPMMSPSGGGGGGGGGGGQQANVTHQRHPPNQSQNKPTAPGPGALVPVNPMASTPKHHGHLFSVPNQPPQQPSSYRSGPNVSTLQPQASQSNLMPTQLSGNFAPVFMQNMVPMSNNPGMSRDLHGTVGNMAATSAAVNMSAVAGATLPRRRGPLPPGVPNQMPFIPPHQMYPPAGGQCTVGNVPQQHPAFPQLIGGMQLNNRPSNYPLATDPMAGRQAAPGGGGGGGGVPTASVVPAVVSSSNQKPQGGGIPVESGGQEVGI
ncbi:Arf-GAP with GTPase, ANK repeat and PH domain-containing protein 3 [Sparganum proliferum]